MEDQRNYYRYVTVAQENDLERATFIRKTYMHTALAVLAFVFFEYLFLNTPAILNLGLAMTKGWTWLLVLGGFMLVTNVVEGWAQRSTDKTQQYIALTIYAAAEAFIFIPLIYIAMSISQDGALLKQAMVITLALFTGLSAVALLTRRDFSFLRNFILIGGFVAIGLIVAGMAFGFSLGLWFSVAMVALAAGSILYQTSNIVHRYNKDQFVAAAIGLFAALMLLFWYILRIVMSFSSSD